MRPLNLRLLRYFVEVAKHENIAKAARVLNISPPPLSRAIRDFEADVGMELFDRSGGRVRLTSAGRELLRNAIDLIKASDRLTRDLKRRATDGDGTVYLGSTVGSIYTGRIPGALRRFNSLYVGSTVKLEIMPEEKQLQGMLEGQLDFCVLPDNVQAPLLEHRTIVKEKFVLMMPADHPLAHVGDLTKEHLAAADWLVTAERPIPSLRTKFITACDRLGFRPRIAYVSGDIVSALAMVSEGLGLCMAQAGVARFADARTVVQPLPALDMDIEYRIAWRGNDLSEPAKRFLALLPDDA